MSGTSVLRIQVTACLVPSLDVDSDRERSMSAPGPTPPREEDPDPKPLPISSSSFPDETEVGLSTAVLLDNFRTHQELLKQVASSLGLKVEELKEPMDDLFGIVAMAAAARVALLVHGGVW